MSRETEREILAYIKKNFKFPEEFQSRSIHKGLRHISRSYIYTSMCNLAARNKLVKYTEGERVVYFTLPDPDKQAYVWGDEIPESLEQKEKLLLDILRDCAHLLPPETRIYYANKEARDAYYAMIKHLSSNFESSVQTYQTRLKVFGPIKEMPQVPVPQPTPVQQPTMD